MKKHIQAESVQPSGPHKTTIGGQALIEGLMMIGPDKKAMAVRKPDGTILVEVMSKIQNTGIANLLFIRGSVRLFRQLVSGTKALLRSAEFVEDEPADDEPAKAGSTIDETASGDPIEAQPARLDRSLRARIDRFFENHTELMLYASAILGILFSVGLFILLPNFIAGFIRQLTPLKNVDGRGGIILINLIEGVIRISLFVGYLTLASRMKDIRRVWMYHGAEHKTIACYEAGRELTVENCKQYSRFHPRCGTAFMFIVILVSIIVFSLVGWWGRWINLLIRFALVPIVAGIAYEIIRLAGRFDNRLTRLVSAPGLWLQRLTTAEPDGGMLEVAIAAMNAVLPQKTDSDRW
jgi:uncharacterized protein YqhQ